MSVDALGGNRNDTSRRRVDTHFWRRRYWTL